MNFIHQVKPVGLTIKPKTLDDVPQTELAHMAVKIYMIGAMVWDYTDTVLDIAAQMRIVEAKKLSRTIRELRKEYDYIRSRDLDCNHIKREWEMAELFESVNKEAFQRLCNVNTH